MGMLIAIVQLSATFVQPVIMIMSNVPKLNSVKPIIKRIDDFLTMKILILWVRINLILIVT